MIAVIFDSSGGRGDAARLSHALTAGQADIIAAEGFHAAHAPPVRAAAADGVRCLLEGEFLNSTEVCQALDVSPSTDPPALAALAFRRWDVAAFSRFRGTFAIAVWDTERGRGALAGDHFASRPWYLQRSDRRVLAATGMRPLLRMLPTPPEPDPIRAITWLASTFAPGAETFARGVDCLPGGHAVLLADGRVTVRRWWHPVYREPLHASRSEVVERMHDALHAAVRTRLAGDETTGIILSGGFDSSAVTGVAASESRRPERLRTYSAGFPDEPAIDESGRVRNLVVARGLSSHVVRPTSSGAVRLALEYHRDWGIPSGGPGYLLERPLLERAAEDGVSTILDGQGGDEVFGFSPYLIADRVRAGQLRTAWRLLGSLPDQVGRASRHKLRYQWREYVVRPLLPVEFERRLRRRGDPARHLPSWLRRDRLDLFLATDSRLGWKQAGDGPLWWRHRVHLMTTIRAGLSEYIGHRARDLDLQMRPPLFDVELTDLALRLPPELAFGQINRALARESVYGEVPDSVRLATKKSDLQPFYHRTLTGADLASVRTLLEPADARIYEYVDRARMLEMLQRPTPVGERGWRDWTAAIWVGLTGEIALQSLEDDGFCQRFLETHDPPAAGHTVIRPGNGSEVARSSFSQP